MQDPRPHPGAGIIRLFLHKPCLLPGEGWQEEAPTGPEELTPGARSVGCPSSAAPAETLRGQDLAQEATAPHWLLCKSS